MIEKNITLERNPSNLLAVVLAGFILGITAPAARAQCESQWVEGFDAVPTGTNGTVRAFTVFDDGTGPALYVGGDFTTAGGVNVNYIAKWDGKSWSPLGTGMNGSVVTLAVFDADGDGPGPAVLYAGGSFTVAGGVSANTIARWNGTSWSFFGSGMFATLVNALIVFDADGTGPTMPALYAGGSFSTPARKVAKWDGTSWSDVGNMTGGTVYAFAVFDTGSGPSLYAGGSNMTAATQYLASVARLSGNSWQTTDVDFSGPVYAFAVFESGAGSSLYAGGSFSVAGRSIYDIARWDGAMWSSVGSGLSGSVTSLAVYDAAFGRSLYAGGDFYYAGNTNVQRVAKWNGVSWSGVGTGANDTVLALGVFDDGLGSSLYVGGEFSVAGAVSASRIAKTNGSMWAALHMGEGASDTVQAFDVVNTGGGSVLYARGQFRSVGNVISNGIAEWDGTSWRSLAGGVTDGDVRAIAVYDTGSGDGPAVVAAGSFGEIGGVAAENIAKWDGTSWSPLGSGMNLPVDVVAVYDDGNGAMLYAAGDFFVAGGESVNRIARWDGQSWTPLGEPGSGLAGGIANSLVVFNDGTGAQLYVGGEFTYVNDDPIGYIARWNGASWSGLGAGLDGPVTALDVLRDGNGPAVYVRGTFYTADGARANGIARWDGTRWDTLGGGLDYYGETVNDLAVYNDGTGHAVYATGSFTSIGGVPARHIAKWDGSTWSPLGNYGLNDTGHALEVFDDGSGPALFVAGDFTEAGGLAARRAARWDRTGWSVLDIGINSGSNLTGEASINALAVLNSSLYLGGTFETAGPFPSLNFARWEGCPIVNQVAGDFNGDSDVDLQDFAIFEACAAGPAVSYDPQNLPENWPLSPDSHGIIAPDFDRDRDIDLRDFAVFQNSMIGP